MIRYRNFFQMVAAAVWATFLATGSLQAQATRYAPQVGQAHKDFILPSIDDGKPIQLSDFRGKKVLLMHFASW